ncbi:MAG: hypothetical protein A2521_13255 [Deltaproteobacteria bacterium RIFOXYD12_FULL_57_12]|nr:MAG: hypothetical protein A2521_13255 [Deltaproteobacteria bacterium RIFOXYD12_FULL_57_12]
MARILFLQPQQFAYAGLYYICGTLKSVGHQYSVLAANRPETISKHIREFAPDIIGFPCLTGMHREILAIASSIKEEFPGARILLGGIHPTLFPDILRNPNVDFICRGEGEWPTAELLNALDAGLSSFDIPNISWKKNGEIFHNEMRPLLDPLDSLPFPDYSIYRDIPVIAADTYPTVFMTRGCPFSCTYCHNSNQRKIYKGKGKYVRSFSPERILDEVEAVISQYPNTTAVFLGADTLGTDLGWLTDLLTRYRARFDMPYNCLIRPEHINEELARLLKETNCHMIAFGIESGSERIRRDLLRRGYPNKQIMQAAGLLKKYGIRFRTYNIIGFPTETPAEMMETLRLNLEIKPDFPWCSIYTPYPETKLSEYSVAHGYLDKNFTYDDVPLSFFNDTVLKNVDRNFIVNLHSFFQTMVLFPSLTPLLKYLLRIPPNRVFRFLFKAVYSYVCIRSENRTVVSFLKLALANRKFFK